MQQSANQNLSDILLERLEDIHPAVEPSWWPPAPGWWLLGAVVLAAMALLCWKAWQRYRDWRRRRDLLRLLDAISNEHDPVEESPAYLAAVNALVRGVALRAFPDQACARLEGEEWVQFIQSRLPKDSGRDNDPLSVLALGPFQKQAKVDPEPLIERVRQWVVAYG